MNDRDRFYSGNAIAEGRRGWFIGQFVQEDAGLRHQDALEVKWGQHPKGERRCSFVQSKSATTISILISGTLVTWLKIDEELREIVLAKPGDYIAYGPGIEHSWEALEDSLLISVRFPSVADDQIEAPVETITAPGPHSPTESR